MSRHLALLLCVLAPAAMASASVLTVDGAGSATMYSAMGGSTYGNGGCGTVGYFGGVGRELIRFDVSSLAGQNITIDSASLTMTCWYQYGTDAPGTIDAYREEANWTCPNTAYGVWVAGPPSWSTAANFPFDSTTLIASGSTGSYPQGERGSITTLTFTPAGLALIADWIKGTTDQTKGLLLRVRDESYQNGEDFQYAQLTVNYTITPEPATLCVLALGGIGALLRRRRA